MPANQKYLTENGWQKFAKISSGLLGGYSLAALIHMNIFLFVKDKPTFLSIAVITIFLVWVTFLIVPFLFKNGWKVWLIYIGLIAILSVSFYLLKI